MAGVHRERELESPTFHTVKEWLKHRGPMVIMNDIISDGLKISTSNKMPRDLLSISTTIGIIMRKLKWIKGTNEDSDKYYAPEDQQLMMNVEESYGVETGESQETKPITIELDTWDE